MKLPILIIMSHFLTTLKLNLTQAIIPTIKKKDTSSIRNNSHTYIIKKSWQQWKCKCNTWTQISHHSLLLFSKSFFSPFRKEVLCKFLQIVPPCMAKLNFIIMQKKTKKWVTSSPGLLYLHFLIIINYLTHEFNGNHHVQVKWAENGALFFVWEFKQSSIFKVFFLN